MTVNESAFAPCAVGVHLPNGTNREREEVSKRSGDGITIPQLPADYVRISDVPSVIAYGLPFSIQEYLYSALVLAGAVLKAQVALNVSYGRRGWELRTPQFMPDRPSYTSEQLEALPRLPHIHVHV